MPATGEVHRKSWLPPNPITIQTSEIKTNELVMGNGFIALEFND